MKIIVRNLPNAEKYVRKVVGEGSDNYTYAAVVDSQGSPELAYEMVGKSIDLEIRGLTEIGEEFEEDTFALDAVKLDYLDELYHINSAHEVLKDHGFGHYTDISLERTAEDPYSAVQSLEGTDIRPVLKGKEANLSSVIRYHPDGGNFFEPAVQAESEASPEEAREREKELEKILDELDQV